MKKNYFNGINGSDSQRRLAQKLTESDRPTPRGGRNVTGRYPSKKMRVTIQFESHRVELAAVYEMEHDRDVIEYYDQPPSFKIEYEGRNGRRQVVIHTPDYFAVRKNIAEWIECKTEEQLLRLAEKSPNRYRCDEDGQWRCPPGEAYAEQFGFNYRVLSSKEINWAFQRNFQFLQDYLRIDAPVIDDEARKAVLELVSAERNIKLEELFSKTEGAATRDDIYTLIATEEIYVDLGAFPLVDPERIRVFPDKDTAIAYANVVETSPDTGVMRPRFFNLVPGTSITWDGKPSRIVNVGETMVGLLAEDNSFREVPVEAFEELVKEGRVIGIDASSESSINSEVTKLLAGSSKEDFEIANYRHDLVSRRLRGEPIPDEVNVKERTVRFWETLYRKAERVHGTGYIGLLPQISHRGSNDTKLPDETWALINDFIDNDYETLKQKRKYEVWAALKKKCDELHVIAPSYKTFVQALKKSSKYNQTLKRQGPRAAYKYQQFYWELNQTTPRHGDRPFEITILTTQRLT